MGFIFCMQKNHSFYRFCDHTCPNYPELEVGNIFAMYQEKLFFLFYCDQSIQIFYRDLVILLVTSCLNIATIFFIIFEVSWGEVGPILFPHLL